MTSDLWADVTALSGDHLDAALAHVRTAAVDAVLLRPEQLDGWKPVERLAVAVLVGPDASASDLAAAPVDAVVADGVRSLAAARSLADGRRLGVRCLIDDGASMDEAADQCGVVDVLLSVFTDETNIPLELLLARAQGTRTAVFKALATGSEASTVAGVLESGPAGVLVDAASLVDLDVAAQVVARQSERVAPLVPLTVTASRPIGMGYRGCIDTTTLFDDDEGMIIGSTSSGGILVCAEVHYLPYMDLRPFRVNAGAVHSYVFSPTTTSYITDLRAGAPVSGVSAAGRFRDTTVGRVKIELRPLRLLEARDEASGSLVNVILQDDWHVRVMGDGGEVRNLTQVKPGEKLLGGTWEPGRHVGIKVSEKILEN
ncbi:3-dehydroquinate synthase II [Quadrisphaera oryzae]|uniref:3-dehydroquinate synthase II n=1 Tax=Quadrisphaera TaxID=317661 RepID=UPI00164422C5|nr:3-dehydroquinate synthase II [Quadrisphaera sp. RL12-1S]MBC3763064.1 3-dehydroquinate synthase [Quadrisphaera sp. RL12-1S]